MKLIGSALGVATLALSLAACSGTSTPVPTSVPTTAPVTTSVPTSTPSADGESGASCFVGVWTADIVDLASQLGAFLASNGLTAEAVTGDGVQQLTVDEAGTATVVTGVRFGLVADLGGTRLDVTQDHKGMATAEWAWSGSEERGTVTFTNFDADYAVDNVVLVDGVRADVDVPIDASPAVTSGTMNVTCTGDTLTTHQEPMPFTITWLRDR